jgi:hypothetical protein
MWTIGIPEKKELFRSGEFDLNKRSPLYRGLIGFWPLRPNSGHAKDYSATRNHGIRAASTPFSTTVVKDRHWGPLTALTFSGVANRRFGLKEFTPTDGLSILARISFTGSGTRTIFSNQRQRLILTSAHTLQYDPNIGAGATYTYATPLVSSTPYFVAVTQDASTNYAMYLDSAVVSSGTSEAFGTTPLASWIGSFHSSPQSSFTGEIWDVRVYNRALTQEEVILSYRKPWEIISPTQQRPSLLAIRGEEEEMMTRSSYFLLF